MLTIWVFLMARSVNGTERFILACPSMVVGAGMSVESIDRRHSFGIVINPCDFSIIVLEFGGPWLG